MLTKRSLDLRQVRAAFLGFALVLLVVSPSPVFALDAPKGDVILTLNGKISETNGDGVARFDREMLKAIGLKSLTTTNPFETGVQQFEGVLLSDVLKMVGADGTRLIATALDGYAIEIPIEDPMTYPVLIAMVWNGQEMKVRNKGPLWIVYPVDQYDDLSAEQYSARSIWQLRRIEVE